MVFKMNFILENKREHLIYLRNFITVAEPVWTANVTQDLVARHANYTLGQCKRTLSHQICTYAS